METKITQEIFCKPKVRESRPKIKFLTDFLNKYLIKVASRVTIKTETVKKPFNKCQKGETP